MFGELFRCLYVNDFICPFNSSGAPTNWAKYSYSVNTLANLSYTCAGNGWIYLDSLKITTYKTTTVSVPTNTNTATGIKTFENSELSLFVSGNVIKSNVSNEDLKIMVFDLSGKKVLETSLKNETKSDLNSGIYILSVFNQSNEILRSKRVLITN